MLVGGKCLRVDVILPEPLGQSGRRGDSVGIEIFI